MAIKKFWEAWGDIEALNAKLSVLVVGLLVLVAILSIALVKTSFSPKPIYCIPGATEAGIVYPGKIPDEVIGIFAQNFVLNLINFTSATIEESRTLAQKHLSPSFLQKMKAGLDEEIKRTKAHNISSLLSASRAPEVKKTSRGYLVDIAGRKKVYLGADVISDEDIIYTLTLEKVRPTDVNPYGLTITNIEQTIPKE